MEAILSGYQVSQTAWLYLSSMLIIAVFYRFRRLWSLRNFDLYLLLLLSPGVLMVKLQSEHSGGYAWLFVATALCTVRLLMDRFFSKRSRVDPNLNSPGLTFLGVCAFAFLMTEAITRPASPTSVSSVMEGKRILQAATKQRDVVSWNQIPSQTASPELESNNTAGPTASLLAMPAVSTSRQLFQEGSKKARDDLPFGIVEETAARILAILSHVAILVGLYWMGHFHFHDRTQGLAMATLYLLMPCTSYVVGEVNQVLPSAFIIWALVFYQYPMISGVLMGFACGSMFFPIFLLPIWWSFYGWRKALWFLLGVTIVAMILLGVIAMISADTYAFTQQTINRIDLRILSFDGGPHETGFWTSIHPAYRIPVMVAFMLLVITLTVWPWKKNLEVLLSYNTAIVVFTQFWYPQLGGIYVLWYLPLLILVVFRPRLVIPKENTLSSLSQTSPLNKNSHLQRPASSGTITAPLYR